MYDSIELSFDELGVEIHGIEYGSFTGQIVLAPNDKADSIWIERTKNNKGTLLDKGSWLFSALEKSFVKNRAEQIEEARRDALDSRADTIGDARYDAQKHDI